MNKKEASMHPKGGKYIRSLIFGFNDGTVSNLALVAGLSGAMLGSKVVILGGLADMIAGAISMGLGNYIATKSQVEFYRHEYQREKEEIKTVPKLEKKEIEAIYRKKGFKGKELAMVVKRITSNKKRWLKVMMEEEIGVNKKNMENPSAVGWMTFGAFLLAAAIPVLPYFVLPVKEALILASVTCMSLLFAVGVAKTHYTGRDWLRSGIEMVIIGAIATLASYYLGDFFNNYLTRVL
ncbi:VIT1/CCC1 transporter family protein [Candidatus Woesearchaeota archaeon]|nr:VIT1/CCC1 transporter family protein [Candidatus Woesearchaeota archaeon]